MLHIHKLKNFAEEQETEYLLQKKESQAYRDERDKLEKERDIMKQVLVAKQEEMKAIEEERDKLFEDLKME